MKGTNLIFWPEKMAFWKVTGTILVTFFLFILLLPLPRPLFRVPYSTTLRAADGTLLSASIAGDEQWRFPASDSIPARFVQCLLLYEDEYFHYHPGINPVSLIRATLQNIRKGRIVSGGSTLTMQTIRLAFGNQSRTFFHKSWETLLALKLDLTHSKDEILSLYAAHAPFGSNIVGLNAAAWRYYGRPPEQLSWAETAALAILPNHPAAVYPGKNETTYREKRDRLLEKLHQRGILDKQETYLARQEPLPGEIKPLPNEAYHLLHRAMSEGHSGKNIISTLDASLQARAREKINRYSQKLKANYIHNAAALIIEIETGNALVYVGNTDQSGNHGQHVDIVNAPRSPGSLLKPILYSAALDEGLILPGELLPDIPMFYQGFAPQNFDKKFRGAIPANEALVSSLNVPFVYLLREYGIEKFHQKLKDMGMQSLQMPAAHYGLSLILGGTESSLWEMTALYAGMARSYFRYPQRPYRHGYSPTDYHPNAYLHLPAENEILDEYGPLHAASIGFAFRAMQQLRRPNESGDWQLFGSSRPLAWKTGTSFGFRDAWAIGINNRYVVGVWAGNADGEGRPGLTGILSASPLMFDLFDLVPGDARFDMTYGGEISICPKSGMVATPHCENPQPMNVPDYMTEGRLCHFHQPLFLTADSLHQATSACHDVNQLVSKSWFILPPVQAWYYKPYHADYKVPPPFMAGCTPQNDRRAMELIYPRQFTKVFIPIEQDGTPGRAIFEAAHQSPKAIIYWHLDEQYIGQTERVHQMGIQAGQGPHTLTLIDEKGNELIQRFEVLNDR
ncbi:MAG: penicillin-binding protein 1C [Cyclobacteriaceae bacterium]|nr:penicillin-binding protein 1C [Cyclobacteriaceae bacterium]